MTYLDPRASNYYQNGFGRSATNCPLDTRLMWAWLRDPAGRRAPDSPSPIDEDLREQYQAIAPRFGADLVVR
jgi:4-hydroxyacetophenone monooxygenase